MASGKGARMHFFMKSSVIISCNCELMTSFAMSRSLKRVMK